MTEPRLDSGVYLFVFRMRAGGPVKVGALAELHFPPGLYAYVGSARRALHQRLQRHCRKRKPRRWHIDYLSRRIEPLWASVWSWAPGRECRLAALIEELGLGGRIAPRFGASDCRCAGHLLRLTSTCAAEVSDALSESLRDSAHVVALHRPGRQRRLAGGTSAQD